LREILLHANQPYHTRHTFPNISLLLIAYTNRFLAIANLIRGLKVKYESERHPDLIAQIKNLHARITLIRDMQALGIAACSSPRFLLPLYFLERQ
jgi:hypothetical protein